MYQIAMKIIFLSGYAGSGKDEAAAIFQTQGFKRYAFADEVKIYSSKVHGFDYSLTQSQAGKATIVHSLSSNASKSVRQFLIDDSAQKKGRKQRSSVLGPLTGTANNKGQYRKRRY